ncbi:GNAT family N-acetyltransferase [Paenibacillus allorhizosphaerae]|uniref:Streptothricin acetyltransferase A n=1 Tax=Paenibacillus allorhizosphaerae TaxID=2849866 RepID=A0ABN7TEG2_9BACL|nr:GNAT family N-acetyltransferase [Paenibacillus allorhizosphaerae]CAG7628139.1 Streptothricin acetyltransferase A [Paenibacillus allorhizosphaerae]
MDIVITELNADNVKEIQPIDDGFIVDCRLVLSVENDRISYTIEQIPSYEKRYADDPDRAEEDSDYSEYLHRPDRVIYLAFADHRFAGLIQLKKHWNNYALVEDIKVDHACRRHGIGRRLIEHAKQWAAAGQMPGIMLETQNNNVKACKFYESCGFVIGGFDFNVYKGLDPNSRETAVYWYYLLN